jgi:hypothetical protein
MMISRIIENNHHLFLSGTMMDQVFQKFAKRFSIELLPLLGQQSPIPQMNCPIQPYLLMGRSLPENRIFNLMRNPHHRSRSMLLKMALIQAPKIKVVSSHPLAEFFYMLLALLGLRLQSLHGAYVAGTPADEKGADIVSSQPSNQTFALNGGTIRHHPIVPEDIQEHSEVFVNQLPLVSVGVDSTRNAALSPLHPITPSILPLGTDGTSIGWSEASVPTDYPLRRCSFHGKEKAIHEVDGHIGILGTLKFPVVKPLSRSRNHQRLVFPWHPPFWVTMVTQNPIIRNLLCRHV